jgi:hypothetical protein
MVNCLCIKTPCWDLCNSTPDFPSPTCAYTPSPSLCGRPSMVQAKIGDTVKVHRRLSSTGESRAALCSAWLRGAPAGSRGGLPGGRGEKGHLDCPYVGRRASASDRSRLRQPCSLRGSCPVVGEFAPESAATVAGCSTEPLGRGPPKASRSCCNFPV